MLTGYSATFLTFQVMSTKHNVNISKTSLGQWLKTSCVIQLFLVPNTKFLLLSEYTFSLDAQQAPDKDDFLVSLDQSLQTSSIPQNAVVNVP